MYEALMRVMWKVFSLWFDAKYEIEKEKLEEAMKALQNICDDTCQDEFEESFENASVKFIFNAFSEFLGEHSQSQSLSAFWVSYLDIVELLLNLLRSTRQGNWQLHLCSIREMLPWCFAYDCTNYARYLSVYYRDMQSLEENHPDTYMSFMEGGFSVQMSSSNTFGRIPMDQATEETINKDTQTAGGTKGFSLNPGAISRFVNNVDYEYLVIMLNSKLPSAIHILFIENTPHVLLSENI